MLYALEFALPWRPSVTASGWLRDLGRVWVEPPPEERVEILGHVLFGDEAEPVENQLFEFTEALSFDGKAIEGQLAIVPQRFINNPAWTLDDLLTTSGPVQLLLLNPRKTFGPGQVVPSHEVIDRGTGTMKVL